MGPAPTPDPAAPAGAPGRPRLARLPLTGKPREEIALERGLLVGVAAFRWVTWAWMAIVLVLDIRSSPTLAHPVAGLGLVGLALVWTATASVLVRRHPSRLLEPPAIAVELAIALLLVGTDWWVYGAALDHAQSLGSAWPVAVILTVGIAGATRAGLAVGVLVGLTRLAGQAAFGPPPLVHAVDRQSAAGTVVLYALAGAVAGFVTQKLREAEREIAVARAREEVARTLHDGVLQTLAIVQRRSTDAELVALAREQEQDLRTYLFDPAPTPGRRSGPASTDLATAVRSAAATAERRHGVRTQVVVATDLAPVAEATATAVAGAVAEAVTNAAKHGAARSVTVFLDETDEGAVFCSVKDDGVGFDPTTTVEGVGITGSIRGRIAEVGGTVEVDGRPGRGAEVRLLVPLDPT